MITSALTKSNKEQSQIIAILLDDFYDNQLIIGDIHAPMDKLSDVYTIFNNNKIIGGWTLFKGFDIPTAVFPPNLPESWGIIKQIIEKLNYPEIFLTFPKTFNDQHEQLPWDDWVYYKWKHMFTDKAMRYENEAREIMNISQLPNIRAAGENDIPDLNSFFDEIKKNPDYTGFWHPQQLKSDHYVVAENEKNKIIAVAGTHFETPMTVQVGNVHVLSDYRNKGIGKAISTAVVLGIIRSKRIPTLFVNEHNIIAQKMYEQIGFKFYNEYMFYKGDKL